MSLLDFSETRNHWLQLFRHDRRRAHDGALPQRVPQSVGLRQNGQFVMYRVTVTRQKPTEKYARESVSADRRLPRTAAPLPACGCGDAQASTG